MCILPLLAHDLKWDCVPVVICTSSLTVVGRDRLPLSFWSGKEVTHILLKREVIRPREYVWANLVGGVIFVTLFDAKRH